MIRPIKIFLYFLLISLLVVLFDQWLGRVNFPVTNTLSNILEPQNNDSVSGLLITEAEQTDTNVTITLPDSLPPKDTLPRINKPIIVSDSVLTAPPLFQELYRSFCQKAQTADSLRQVVRVLHIGDSQIEADRITAILRKHFQQLYGGSGPGFVMPIDPLQINANVSVSHSDNWTLSYSYKKKRAPVPVRYGISGKATWFSDSAATFTIQPIAWKSQRLRKFPNIRLLLSAPDAPLYIKSEIDDHSRYDTLARRTDILQLLSFQDSVFPRNIRFYFSGTTSPVIHGITLDNTGGVAVDNLAMRGRPWPGLRISDHKMVREMAQQLNTGFVILQFGTNVLPTKTDNYNFYRIHFLKELQLLKELLPGVPVLVIGVQAAAESKDGKQIAMEHARLISEAQKAATLACDMAFFDLHKAMGGTRGAIDWANETPSLMLSDLMHFSGRGARVVGDQIWMALDSLRNHLQKPVAP